MDGLCKIIMIQTHKVQIQITPKKSRGFYNNRTALMPGTSKEREVHEVHHSAHQAETQPWGPTDQLALIKTQFDKLQALQRLKQLQMPQLSPQLALISSTTLSIHAPIGQVANCLRELSYIVFNSSPGTTNLCTSEEINYWQQFEPSLRSHLIASHHSSLASAIMEKPTCGVWRTRGLPNGSTRGRANTSGPEVSAAQATTAPSSFIRTPAPTRDQNKNPTKQTSKHKSLF